MGKIVSELKSDDGRLGSGPPLGFGIIYFLGRIDGDLDSNGSATNFFALQNLDSILLLLFVANVNEAVTLAPSGLTPPPADNTG